MSDWLHYLLPWEFSPLILATVAVVVALYLRGMRRLQRAGQRIGMTRALTFLAGVLMMYGVTQTYFDYLSQYMFFVHRGQHLVLHHLAPFLIALSAPGAALAAGTPRALRRRCRPLLRSAAVVALYRALQHPATAAVLFVGLIYFWLIPSIHFDAMLSRDLYMLMNWSMALDGLLFWWIILDRRPADAPARVALGWRIAMLVGVLFPQIALGARIALSERVLFDVYEVCGRAWPLSPLTDQQLGGLLTWIPPAMMSVVGVLVVLSYLLGDRGSLRPTPDIDKERVYP